MSAPRLEVDLGAVEANTRALVERLGARGIRVTGVTKAALGSPGVAAAMLAGGASGLGDSRLENLVRLETAGLAAPRTLIRSPMLSQVDGIVRHASTSLNTEKPVLEALSRAAVRLGATHAVVLMVELGDLSEGVLPADLVPLAVTVAGLAGLALTGIGTNLACQSGVVPDQDKMRQLSDLAADVEAAVRDDAVGGLRRQLREPRLGARDGRHRSHRRPAPRRGDPARPRPPDPTPGPRPADRRRS